jgi:hypothetical protein
MLAPVTRGRGQIGFSHPAHPVAPWRPISTSATSYGGELGAGVKGHARAKNRVTTAADRGCLIICIAPVSWRW